MDNATPSFSKQLLAEFLGTFILILIGDGSVAVAVFTDAYNLAGVSLFWGVAVMLAVYTVGYISGGHYNPAVTVAMTAFGGFSPRKAIPYICAQVAGAFAGAATVYGMWHTFFEPAAAKMGLTIGGPGSERLAGIFCSFYPKISTLSAVLTEVCLTGALLIVIWAVGNTRNSIAQVSNIGAVFVGLAVMVLVAIGGPLTSACMNPARDLGPRLLTYLVGFGTISFPGPHGHEWWVFWVGPITGALVGSVIYRFASAEK
jgi:glycerol uptake facilitator protein